MALGIKRSFVQRDIEILSSLDCRLRLIQTKPSKHWVGFLLGRIIELFMCLWFVAKSKRVISWFNDYHSFFLILLAKLFSVKSLILVGGYDAISNSKIRYGLFLKPNLRQILARWSYRHCSNIWVVHKSLAVGCPYANKQPHINSGIKYFLPHLKTPIVEVPTGYDSNFWKPSGNPKESIVLTIGIIEDKRTYQLKGIDVFISLAKRLKEFRFIVVGINQHLVHSLKTPKPKNLEYHPRCSEKTLREYYQKSKFYFQGSSNEGLPNVLCEAMLCECIPIARGVFGMPDIIGSTGYLFNDSAPLEKTVEFIHSANMNLGSDARKRIIKQYPISKRIDAFNTFLQS